MASSNLKNDNHNDYINFGTNNNSQTGSTPFHDVPIELTSVKGYKDFLRDLHKDHDRKFVTVLNEEMTQGYIIENGNIIANIQGDARNYLVHQACDE